MESFRHQQQSDASAAARLHDVPLQHGHLLHDTSEAEAAQVQRLKVPVQNELGHGAAHGGGVLQAVAAEAGGKVHVVDERVNPDDAVLVEGVVIVETRPGAGHLRGAGRHRRCYGSQDGLDLVRTMVFL